jgi:hypothetical protein
VALAESGQHQKAELIARSIVSPESQATALAGVAVALAMAGQHQKAGAIAAQAETIARSIVSPESQSYALAQVAEALARIGETRFASRLVAETCIAGEWATAARAVLLLMPSAFTTPEEQ